MAGITLNNRTYSLLDDKITQTYVRRQTEPYRIIGTQKRANDSSVNRYFQGRFPLGIGWARMDRETGRGVGGLLDATCDTGFRRTTLGRLQVTTTHAAPADHVRKMADFKGNLWGLFESNNPSAGADSVESRQFQGSTDTWQSGGVVESVASGSVGPRAYDLVVHKGYLVAAIGSVAVANEEIKVFSSADGATWADISGAASYTEYEAATPMGRADNRFTDDYARLLSFGNTLLLAGWDEDGSGNIEIQESTDAPTGAIAWVPTLTNQISSRAGPRAFVDWYDRTGARAPVLVTVEGIYSIKLASDTSTIDLSADTTTLIYKMDGHTDNGRFTEVGNDGALYVGLGSGKLLRLAITDNNRLEVMVVGPPGDGFVAARQGRINYILKTPSEWLLVAVGGDTSARNASVFKIDTSVMRTDPETGKQFMPWYHVYQHATANRDITCLGYSTNSATADGIPRLHIAIEGAADGSAAETIVAIEEPLTDPDSGVTISYQTSSILRLPDDDLGDPQTLANIYQALVDCDGLGTDTTDNYIAVTYGTNGAVDTTTTLGNFFSNDLDLPFGSGIGISAKRIGVRLTFNQDDGSTTTTPLLGEFEIQAEKRLFGPRQWSFVIDIAKTAEEYKPSNAGNTVPAEETIITNIETAAEVSATITFEVGQLAEIRVRIPNDTPPEFRLKVVDATRDNKGYRTGVVAITVQEFA